MSDDYVKPTLYAHVFEWYCEKVGPGDHAGHFPEENAKRLVGWHDLDGIGETDAHGGQRLVTIQPDGSRGTISCKCSAFLRRRPLAPNQIKL